MKITPQTILAISPHANPKLLVALPPALNRWLPIYGMTNKEVVRQALGQWAEETDGFRVFKEYASGAAYEGRKDLGNTQAGDGVKFPGEGIDMITGRGWYTRIGKETGLDLVNHPELLLIADYAVESGCQFWKDEGLITLGRFPQNFHAISVKINGGTNGIEARWAYYQAACHAITEDLDITLPPQAPAVAPAPIPVTMPPLPQKPQTLPQRVPSVPAKPPFSFWGWLQSFFHHQPAPMGLLGDTQMTVVPTVNKPNFLSNLNILSLLSAFGGLTALLPKILTEFSTAGMIAAGAMVVGILIQALIPAGTAVAIENTAANQIIPAIEGFDPKLKPLLEQVASGLRDAAISAANTAAAANSTAAVTAGVAASATAAVA